MARGTKIVVSSNPKGVFLEGIVSGTPQPGTVMEIKNAPTVGGRAVWQVWSKASGAKGLIAVLMPDYLQGKLGIGANANFTPSGAVGGASFAQPGDAYVTGTRCFLYVPHAGEELNMLVASVAGTADDVAIGDLFGVQTATGKLLANSAFASPCFTAMEPVTDPTADYMLWTTFNGH